MADGLEDLKRHIGETTTEHDVATVSQAGRLAAVLDVDNPVAEIGDPLPQGWYGIFFPPLTPTAKLREDGQPGEGLMPPVPLPRRQLDGVRAEFHAPIRVGDTLEKVSEVADITVDDGPVVGVTIAERISAEGKLSVVETRSFRFFGPDGPPGGAAESPVVPATADWSRSFEPNPVRMFSLSAVRFNRHRVHYDRGYTMGKEGMPGLAVPITLVSSQMIEMLREEIPGRELAALTYRAVRRLFDTGPYAIHGARDGNDVLLWATDHEGGLTTLAEARLA